MSTFRSNINVKALGLHWRDGSLLAAEVYDGQGRVTGVRPLGGTVEFGESSQTALKREFLEELGVAVEILSGPIVLENLYTFEGENGHEIMFFFEVAIAADAYLDQEALIYTESDGTSGIARWYALEELDRPGSLSLYPRGLRRFWIDRMPAHSGRWRCACGTAPALKSRLS